MSGRPGDGRGEQGHDGGASAGTPAAVILLTHVLRTEVVDRFRKLRREASDGHDVFLAYDATGADPSGVERARAVAGERLRAFRASEVLDVAYPDPWADRSRRGVVPGNLDLLYMDLARFWSGYRHYWIVEHDVAFTGHWSTLLDHFSGVGADLLGTTLHRYRRNPDWSWWRSFRPPRSVAVDRWIRGLFSIVRLSRDLLGAVDAAYRAGWSGHAEAVLPTAAQVEGLRIRDMGGDGPFVAEGDRNRFYTNEPEREWLYPGTFVYRPSRPRPGRRPDTLWHPVKPEVGRAASLLKRARLWLARRAAERWPSLSGW